MDSAGVMDNIEEFMESALVHWVQLFEKMAETENAFPPQNQYIDVNPVSHNSRDAYLRLTNGVFLNQVMRIIDPNPRVERLYDNETDDYTQRIQNFSILNRHLRAFYQEDLQQLILMPLPNVAILGQDSFTEAAVEELRRLLLLLLGCAVQCEHKETFIQQIQSMDIHTQAELAICIQQVTQDPRSVLPLRWEELQEVQDTDLKVVFGLMAKHIQSILAQRDTHLQRIAELCREREAHSDSPLPPPGELPQGLALQLVDSKAKVRRLKQQLDDKGDQLLDYKQEIQMMEEELKKLQKENRSLRNESRGLGALRDELDCTREKAARVEPLQNELQSCKQRLRGLEATRTWLKEQQQLCVALQETKDLLEEQLADARARCSAFRDLERDAHLLRQRIMDVEAERDTERQRVDELLELNMSLEADLRQCGGGGEGGGEGGIPAPMAHHRFLPSEADSDEELSDLIDQRPLSVEVGEASALRLLGAEQENASLRRRLEELQAQREFHNLKNENATLKHRLEELTAKLRHAQDKRDHAGVEPSPREDGEKEEGDVRGSQSSRGQGEGMVRFAEEMERGQEVVVTQREAGVGEEVLHVQGGKVQAQREEIQAKRREEAEGDHRDAQELNTPEPGLFDLQTEGSQDTALAGCLREEADRQTQEVRDLRTRLGEQDRKTREAEGRLALLEMELRRLRNAAENLGEARRQIQVLQSEAGTAEEELCRLRSQAELHSMQTTVIASLEGERAALERDRDALRSTVDALRTAHRKSEQSASTAQALKAELERQGRTLETSRRRQEELEAELRDAGAEAQSAARARDQALLDASHLEQEKEACLSELDGSRKEARQRERGVARLRQQLESTNVALEHSNQRGRALDAEHRSVCQQLSESKELCVGLRETERDLDTRLNSLEENKRHLEERYTDAQAKIQALSQDLSNEQTLSRRLTAEVQRLSRNLQKAESELKDASEALNQSEPPAEPQMEPGPGLHPSSQSSNQIPSWPKDQWEESSLNQDRGGQFSEGQLTGRMFQLEKEKAVALAGQDALLSRLAQSRETCEHLKEQLEALRRHSLSLQESCTRLQTLNTQLQVDQVNVNSQLAATQARHSQSEARCAALEAESEVWARERRESAERTEALRRDHQRLTALQQRQETELERLVEKHSGLRTSNRGLEARHRELEASYKELLDAKSHLEQREREMKTEREAMQAEAHKTLERERELESLKEDSERLQGQQKELMASQAELLAQGSSLRGELSASLLERTRLEGELSLLREANQSLDLSNARLTNQYQLLTQLKGNTEEENRHLAEQNGSLLKENRALLEQSLERRDQHYSQQKEYQEKLSELRREKQKLVEKIMDQYRVLEPNVQPSPWKAKKSNWIADRMKKLIKPRGGTREGRGFVTAACSVENLADRTQFALDTPQRDPCSAPGSPCTPRKSPFHPEPEISSPTNPAPRPGSGVRRKLGSRHGWSLTRGGAGVSQSFSPGDGKTTPRHRLFSGQNTTTVLWESGTTNVEVKATPEEETSHDNQHSSNDT
ncbi:coiled-coil domain containing 88A isoform X2 [Stigmatopora argus]